MDTHKYKVGERVFAKIKGYSYWPAFIEGIAQSRKIKKYNVIFYGEKTTACVKEIDICSYIENKVKYGVRKQKNEEFNKALEEAEKSLIQNRNQAKKSCLKNKVNNSEATKNSNISLENNSLKNNNVEITKDSDMSFNMSSMYATTSTPSVTYSHLTHYLNTHDRDPLLSDCHQTNVQKQNTCNELVIELLGQNWVSDDVVSKYFDLLNSKVLKNKNLFCMNPLISQGIKLLDDYSHLLDPPNLRNFNHLFIPVNDSINTSGEGGTHWSLLVYNKTQASFFYYDSCGKYNIEHAQIIAGKIHKYLNNSNADNAKVMLVQSPQQDNNYDCGIFMVSMVDRIIELIMADENVPYYEMTCHNFSGKDVIMKRSIIAYLLNNGLLVSSQTVNDLLSSPKKTDKRLPSVVQSGIKEQTVCVNKYVGNKCQKDKSNSRDQDTSIHKARSEVEQRVNQTSHFVTSRPTDKQFRCTSTDETPKLCSSKNSIKTPKVPSKIYLSCDSQGRGLALELGLRSDSYDIFNCTQPGAPIKVVMSLISNSMDLQMYTKNDYIVIIGGSNDVHSNIVANRSDFLNSFSDYLEKQLALFSHTNLILATVPYRYDLRQESSENKIIKEMNKVIRNLVYRYSHVFLLDLYLLRSCHHTRHGLHINKLGKKFVSIDVLNIIKKNFQWSDSATNPCRIGMQAKRLSHVSPELGLSTSSILQPPLIAQSTVDCLNLN